MTLVHALKWSFLAELASKAITPIVFIVLARLLTPEDFGVMSAALMVIAFSQIFWEAGMGKALIQRQTDVEDAANVAFWVNLCLGLLIAGLLFWGAQPIALTFFKDPRVTAVLQVMTLQVLLAALSSVQTALLQKEMNFKKLFWVRSTTVALPGLASIPLAWNGMGYWSLVAGTLTGQFVQVIMLWRMSSWRPALSFPLNVARPMGKFGAWVGASGLLAWFYVWADSLIVGANFGIQDLGIYRVGNQFAGLIFTLIFGPVVPVLFSQLSRIGPDRKRFRTSIEKVIRILTLIAIPISVIVYQFSDPLTIFIFGDKWQGVGLVVGILALMHGFSWVVGMNGEAYRAMGKPSLDTIVTASTLLVYLGVYFVSVKLGFDYFVWARLFLSLGALLLHLAVLQWVLSVRATSLLVYILLIAVFSFIVTELVQMTQVKLGYDSVLETIAGLILASLIIGAFLVIAERNRSVKDILYLIGNRAK